MALFLQLMEKSNSLCAVAAYGPLENNDDVKQRL